MHRGQMACAAAKRKRHKPNSLNQPVRSIILVRLIEEDGMSIFGKIRDAIFGHAKAQQQAPQSAQAQHPAMPQMGSAPAQAAPAQPQQPATPQPAAQQPVDVEAVLSDIAAHKGQQLNWQSSIVDLMKLLDLDPSLENRKELATELGYQGEKNGSAEMNIWLHRRVMEELEKNGGKVPASLKG